MLFYVLLWIKYGLMRSWYCFYLPFRHHQCFFGIGAVFWKKISKCKAQHLVNKSKISAYDDLQDKNILLKIIKAITVFSLFIFNAFQGEKEKHCLHSLSVHPFVFQTLSLFLCLCLIPTFLAEGNGVVHDPADQSHEQAQQYKEDPVLPHPRDQEFLAARCTHWGHREGENQR